MVIHFIKQIFGVSDPFHDFTSNITRVASILYTMQSDAKHANFKTIEEKADALKRLVGVPVASNSQCLLKLAQKKHAVMAALPHSGEKMQLETMQRDMHQALHYLVREILHIFGMSQHLAKQNHKQPYAELNERITYAQHFAEKMRARSHIQLQAYRKAPKKYIVSEKKQLDLKNRYKV
ncbi:hypothetical protein HZA99_04405 [Candidatus Woesearchaeota archaeon]|nr:hypothetical protein [Candidatus Woesearchaeota archaeon]